MPDVACACGAAIVVVAAAQHERAHAFRPQPDHAVIEGAGHVCNLERPWEYDRVVLDFLARS